MLKGRERILGILFLLFSNACWGLKGSYIGLGLNSERAEFRHNAHITHPGDLDIRERTHYSGKGITSSLFLGYEQCFERCLANEQELYLAAELNADLGSVVFKSNNDNIIRNNFGRATYKMRQGFELSILPGIYVSDCTLFYARLAYSLRNIKISTNEVTLPSTKKYLSGCRYGLGVKQFLTDCFALRLDYSQSFYQRLKIVGVDPTSDVLKNTRITPKTNKFEIGIIYHFA